MYMWVCVEMVCVCVCVYNCVGVWVSVFVHVCVGKIVLKNLVPFTIFHVDLYAIHMYMLTVNDIIEAHCYGFRYIVTTQVFIRYKGFCT